jgi:hypothetical protein
MVTAQPPERQLLGSFSPGSRANALLTNAVRKLRDNASDEKEIALFNDILEGRRSARDLLTSPHVLRLAEEGERRSREHMDAMDEDARQAFEREAERDSVRLEGPEQHNG